MIQDLSSGSDDVAAAKDTTNASVSVPCVPHSPSGVLDALCLSFKSAETTNANANPGSAQVQTRSQQLPGSTPVHL